MSQKRGGDGKLNIFFVFVIMLVVIGVTILGALTFSKVIKSNDSHAIAASVDVTEVISNRSALDGGTVADSSGSSGRGSGESGKSVETVESGKRSEVSVFSIFIVFFCYAVVAVMLIVYFLYRFLSPFKRLITEMEHILAGDTSIRLNLRDKDVFLIKHFVANVNGLIDKVEKMHVVNDEVIKKIDVEGQDILAMLENEHKISDSAKEKIVSYHESIKSIIKER
ncbi:membrane protein [Candidatus Magnetoovum chiemensis]|nr:membrane protein [Candidatus Magnetoovum chiemensis]